MASALPPEVLVKIVGKLSLKDKFKTLSISTKWNNASSMLLELQTGLCITNEIDGEVFRVCDEVTHRIDDSQSSKDKLPVSLLGNDTALDAALKKMPKLKAVTGKGRYMNMDFDLSYKFIQSIMKNGIEIECLAGFCDIINLSSLKHFFGEIDNDSLSHLVNLNKGLELLNVSDTARLLGSSFIGEIIQLEKLHTLHMTFNMGSNVSEEDFLNFISKWKELNRGHLNIVLKQHKNIETDTVRGRLAMTSNINVRFIGVPAVPTICFFGPDSMPLPLRKETRDRLGLNRRK